MTTSVNSSGQHVTAQTQGDEALPFFLKDKSRSYALKNATYNFVGGSWEVIDSRLPDHKLYWAKDINGNEKNFGVSTFGLSLKYQWGTTSEEGKLYLWRTQPKNHYQELTFDRTNKSPYKKGVLYFNENEESHGLDIQFLGRGLQKIDRKYLREFQVNPSESKGNQPVILFERQRYTPQASSSQKYTKIFGAVLGILFALGAVTLVALARTNVISETFYYVAIAPAVLSFTCFILTSVYWWCTRQNRNAINV